MLTFQLAESGPRPLEALSKCTPHTQPEPSMGLLVPRVGLTLPGRIPCRAAPTTALTPSHVCSHRSTVPGLTSWEGGGGGKGKAAFLKSWVEDGASFLQINPIFSCPKIALRSISSPALRHWLCPAPVLSPGQLSKKKTAMPYNLYLGKSLTTDFHSEIFFFF